MQELDDLFKKIKSDQKKDEEKRMAELVIKENNTKMFHELVWQCFDEVIFPGVKEIGQIAKANEFSFKEISRNKGGSSRGIEFDIYVKKIAVKYIIVDSFDDGVIRLIANYEGIRKASDAEHLNSVMKNIQPSALTKEVLKEFIKSTISKVIEK